MNIAKNKSKLKVDIQKDFYHKTKNVNGVQKVDTDNKYYMYRVKIENQYFTEKKDELIKNMLEDIKELETALEKELEGEIERC